MCCIVGCPFMIPAAIAGGIGLVRDIAGYGRETGPMGVSRIDARALANMQRSMRDINAREAERIANSVYNYNYSLTPGWIDTQQVPSGYEAPEIQEYSLMTYQPPAEPEYKLSQFTGGGAELAFTDSGGWMSLESFPDKPFSMEMDDMDHMFRDETGRGYEMLRQNPSLMQPPAAELLDTTIVLPPSRIDVFPVETIMGQTTNLEFGTAVQAREIFPELPLSSQAAAEIDERVRLDDSLSVTSIEPSSRVHGLSVVQEIPSPAVPEPGMGYLVRSAYQEEVSFAEPAETGVESSAEQIMTIDPARLRVITMTKLLVERGSLELTEDGVPRGINIETAAPMLKPPRFDSQLGVVRLEEVKIRETRDGRAEEAASRTAREAGGLSLRPPMVLPEHYFVGPHIHIGSERDPVNDQGIIYLPNIHAQKELDLHNRLFNLSHAPVPAAAETAEEVPEIEPEKIPVPVPVRKKNNNN